MNRPQSREKAKSVLSWVSAVLILMFFLLVTVGSYVKLKTVLVIVYSAIAAGFALFALEKTTRDILKSPMLWLWGAYCLVGLLSTLLFSEEKDLYILVSEVSFTWILLILTRFTEYDRFFVLFRIFTAVLVVAALFQEVTGVYVFAFLKAGTQFAVADYTHGLLSIFEYRHYFGCYLLLALFSLVWFPEKRKWLTAVYAVLFGAAIILTYTRSIWIAGAAGVLIGLFKWLPALRARRKTKEKAGRRKANLRVVLAVVGVVAVIAVLAIVFREQIRLTAQRVIGRFTVLNPNQDSWYNRMFTIMNGPRYVFEHWKEYLFIGAGSGSALDWLQHTEGARFRSAIDCQYVHTFIETGLIGLLLLFGMIGYALVRFFRTKDKAESLFSLTFVMIAVSFFFYEVIVVNSSVYALWVFVLVSLCRGQAEKVHVS